MDRTYWQKQIAEPLYPDILWSRPEFKAGAGKLLIIGGNQHGFGAPGQAYAVAEDAGAGVIRVLLPDAIQKTVKGLLPDADFAPSTPSGSFSRKALGELQDLSMWSDTCLLIGDFGRNSETAILLESFVETYKGPLVVTQDAADYFRETPKQLIHRDNTVLVVSLSQLQKIFINTPFITPITLGMNTLQLVEALHAFTSKYPAAILTVHNGFVFCGHDGRVSTTKTNQQIWRVDTSARASVFLMQNPSKPFESITTALLRD